jgi:hypothetical protein
VLDPTQQVNFFLFFLFFSFFFFFFFDLLALHSLEDSLLSELPVEVFERILKWSAISVVGKCAFLDVANFLVGEKPTILSLL